MEKNKDESEKETSGVSRRELLHFLWLGSLGLLVMTLGGAAFVYCLPRFRPGEFGGVFDTGPVAELPSVGDPPLNVPKGKFWLVRTETGLRAFYKACTHLDCMFNWNEQEKVFVCPCHGSRFAKDGSCLAGPASRDLDQFAVRIMSPSGEVLSETDPESLAAARPLETGVETLSKTDGSGKTGIRKDASNQGPQAVVVVDTGHKIAGRKK